MKRVDGSQLILALTISTFVFGGLVGCEPKKKKKLVEPEQGFHESLATDYGIQDHWSFPEINQHKIPSKYAADTAHPKLGGVLAHVNYLAKTKSHQAALSFARQRGYEIRGDQSLRVLLEHDGSALPSEHDLGSLGVRVLARSESFTRVELPLLSLTRIPEVAGIKKILLPANISAETGDTLVSLDAASTGLESQIDSYHKNGFGGEGISVAVIDTGFKGIRSEIDGGLISKGTILVALDPSNDDLESLANHGTQIVRHLNKLAPQATIHCIQVRDELDLELARKYLLDHNIQIVVHGVNWFQSSYYDDKGIVNQIINQSATNDDALWIVAAGNHARGHWRGGFTSHDGDSLMEFAKKDEALQFKSNSSDVAIYLNWNQYGQTKTDLDLYVFDNKQNLVAKSEIYQTNSNHDPVESVGFSYDKNKEPYSIVIHRDAGPVHDLDVTIFAPGVEFETPVLSSSLADPANASGALTVAVAPLVTQQEDFANLDSTDFTHGHGPTIDSRSKPDLMTDVFGGLIAQTGGTPSSSFAVSHVAGAAVLLKSRYTDLNGGSLREMLMSSVEPLGHNEVFGAGKLVLPSIDEPQPVISAPPVASVADVPPASIPEDHVPSSTVPVAVPVVEVPAVTDTTNPTVPTVPTPPTVPENEVPPPPSSEDPIIIVVVEDDPTPAVPEPETPVEAQPTLVAQDDFETNTTSGGMGWYRDWSLTGDTRIRSDNNPLGQYHIRMVGSEASLKRRINLSGYVDAKLVVMVKVKGFGSNDRAYLKLSVDGDNYQTIKTFDHSLSDDSYHRYEFDISAFIAPDLRIKFESGFGNNDYLFIDDIAIIGNK